MQHNQSVSHCRVLNWNLPLFRSGLALDIQSSIIMSGMCAVQYSDSGRLTDRRRLECSGMRYHRRIMIPRYRKQVCLLYGTFDAIIHPDSRRADSICLWQPMSRNKLHPNALESMLHFPNSSDRSWRWPGQGFCQREVWVE